MFFVHNFCRYHIFWFFIWLSVLSSFFTLLVVVYRAPRNRINPGQRRVVLVSCLHQQYLFHGYGNMEDLHDRYAYHHISFSFILYQRCRDYTWTVWAVSCVGAVPLLYNTCDAKSLRILRDSHVQFCPRHIHFYVFLWVFIFYVLRVLIISMFPYRRKEL